MSPTPHAAPGRLTDRKLAYLLAALTLCKGLVWMAAYPPFKIADEPSHFENVQYRAENWRAAEVDPKKERGLVMHEGAAPEVLLTWKATNAYFKNSYLRNVRSVPEEAKLAKLAETKEGRSGDGQVTSMFYPGFYYDCAVVPYLLFKTSTVLARIIAVRFLSLCFGTLAVLATFFAARRTFDSRALAVAAAFVVIMQPMESQQTVAVNNDAAVIGISAVLFYLQIRLLTSEPTRARFAPLLAIVILSALNVFSKPTGYGMLPASLLAILVALYPFLSTRRARVIAGISVGVGAVVGGGWAYIRYRAGTMPMVPGGVPAADFPSFLPWIFTLNEEYTTYLFRSTFGQFGWLEYSIRPEWLFKMRMVFRLVVLGFVAAIATRIIEPKSARWLIMRAFLWSAGVALLAVLFILFAEYRFRVAGTFGMIQGRNFLFGLPAFAVFVAGSLGALVPARYRTLTAAALATGAFALHLGGLSAVLRNYNAG